MATGGITASGGTPRTGGTTSSAPDAAVDIPAAADATPTPSQTVALFQFDGTNNSTVLTDSSGTRQSGDNHRQPRDQHGAIEVWRGELVYRRDVRAYEPTTCPRQEGRIS